MLDLSDRVGGVFITPSRCDFALPVAAFSEDERIVEAGVVGMTGAGDLGMRKVTPLSSEEVSIETISLYDLEVTVFPLMAVITSPTLIFPDFEA
jgi:hypothetical protein